MSTEEERRRWTEDDTEALRVTRAVGVMLLLLLLVALVGLGVLAFFLMQVLS